MATTRHIEARVEGGPQAIAGIEATARLRSHRLREMLDDIAHYSLYWMRVYAPVGETGYLIRHLDKSPLTWRPGGAGGGGTWEVITGVKRGTSMHPIYVHEGTGIYGDKRKLITSTKIRRYRDPKDVERALDLRSSSDKGDDAIMTFQKRGEPRRFRPYTRGQAPQPYVRLAYLQARIYAASRTTAFFGGL